MTREHDVNRLRKALSEVGVSVVDATTSLQGFGRALAKRQVAELFKRYEANQRAARRRRRRHDR